MRRLVPRSLTWGNCSDLMRRMLPTFARTSERGLTPYVDYSFSSTLSSGAPIQRAVFVG